MTSSHAVSTTADASIRNDGPRPASAGTLATRVAAAAVAGLLLAGCSTTGPVLKDTGPGGKCTPENSISIYCP